MDVVASVEESTSGDGDVGDRMAVEGKIERQLDRHCTSVRLRQQRVDSEIGAIRVNTLSVEIREILVSHDRRVVVLVVIFLDFRDVVLYQRQVALDVVDVDVRPLDLRTSLAAAR